ncbi:Flp family type IVb pilin [Brevundimonas subvibrioides]|uniref:Flp/Fap pilin component n=1 Tax=Brevundimonas subvibrioides (strain ATCC 15264 / DSM 4735 / LMG 14903 / NBRC 16000 / CB 81) TaxID=633149 RepID=D9QIY6_BRESC|nr:Flp family type IVb pilin [Brevundimonas subvibrioides]ADK99510.1 Flp/Fap pilin component [Brevundimonas subvibrioides ATCC 15264]
MSLIRRFLSDERGATAIEYGMIVGAIFLVIVAGATAFSDKVIVMFNRASEAMTAAAG